MKGVPWIAALLFAAGFACTVQAQRFHTVIYTDADGLPSPQVFAIA